jgi:hypothetical protein
MGGKTKSGKKFTFKKTIHDMVKEIDPKRGMTRQAYQLLNNLCNETIEMWRDDAIFITARTDCQTLSSKRCTKFLLARLPSKIRRKLSKHSDKVMLNHEEEVVSRKAAYAEKMEKMSAAELAQHKEKYAKQFKRA